MTSSNENIFRVTGPLWGESIGHLWFPLTKASDVELWCFLWSTPEQTVEQTIQTPVLWDTIALIMTSLWCKMSLQYRRAMWIILNLILRVNLLDLVKLQFWAHIYTETEMSFWRNFHHWLRRNFSFWKNFSEAHDENFVKMTFSFQCMWTCISIKCCSKWIKHYISECGSYVPNRRRRHLDVIFVLFLRGRLWILWLWP